MTGLDYLKGIWGISLCLWGVLGVCFIFYIMKFIVKRYEEDTNLNQTVFFTQHMPFAKHIPNFFSSSLYCGHLLSFVWGWRVIKWVKEKRHNVTYFNDIDSPELVTRHFTTKEIRSVKLVAIIGVIISLHAIAYYIFKSIWPDVFT